MLSKFYDFVDRAALPLVAINLCLWLALDSMQVPGAEWQLGIAFYWAVHHWLWGQQ